MQDEKLKRSRLQKLCSYFCASLQPQAIMGDAGIFTILWKYSHILQNWQIDKK